MGRKPINKTCCVCLNSGLDFNKLTMKDESKVTLITKFRMCISEVQWLPTFYLCTDCTKTLGKVHAFRERCITADLIRKDKKPAVKDEEQVIKCNEGNKQIDSFKLASYIHETKDVKENDIGDLENSQNEFLVINDPSFFSESDQENVKADSESDRDEVIIKKRTRKKSRQEIVDVKRDIENKNTRNKRKRKFNCEKCRKCFLASTKLVTHCVKEHGMEYKNIKPFACDRCPQRFSTSSNMWQHIKYHDGIKSKMCSYCGKSFITKTDLLNHEKKHLNMREYKCELCGKSFNTHKDIRSHKLIVHTDSSLWKYICTICTKRFPIKSNYDSHMRRHLGDKKFACHLCEKKFTTKCDLQRHTKSHSDVREHKCSHCEKEYKDERVLKVHKAKVHGIGLGKVKIPVRERNYVCHFCPKAYFAKNKLTRHLYTHSGEKPFNCPVCEKKFNDKSYVKQHLRNTHNIENNDTHENNVNDSHENNVRTSYLYKYEVGRDVRPV